MDRAQKFPQTTTTLKYKKGEQIFKQSDYGISVYQVLEGKVEVFREHAGLEVSLGVLEKGDVLGEMAFIRKGVDVRGASARAVDDCRLELWHPGDLLKEFEKAPPVLKFISSQAMNRLLRMHSFMERLASERERVKQRMGEEKEPRGSKRRFYRKKVSIPCVYAPAQKGGPHISLKGYIRDLSMTGLRLEGDYKNDSQVPHGVDDAFHVAFELPNGKKLKLTAKIVHVMKRRDIMRVGMVFSELPGSQAEARRALGFFLLR
jgi:CRP-like cAMP-binding protein